MLTNGLPDLMTVGLVSSVQRQIDTGSWFDCPLINSIVFLRVLCGRYIEPMNSKVTTGELEQK